MASRQRLRLVASAAVLALAVPIAHAQEAGDAADAAEPEPAPLTAEEAQAQINMMQAQIEAMQKQLAVMKDQMAKQEKATSWRGAPQFSGSGSSFKLRGRIQYDASSVSDSKGVENSKNLGFQSALRRATLGVDGSFAGDFKYKAEFNFANNGVSYEDVFIEYAPAGSAFSVRLGNMETLYSLEQMSSSNLTQFMERAQMTEAFYTGRRLGLAVGYRHSDVRLDVGLFNTPISSARNLDEWVFGARAVYNPLVGEMQLHFGTSVQYRAFNTNALAFTYQSRPFVRSTDVRFVSTGALAAKSDTSIALEAAVIRGPLHVVAELQRVRPKTISPGDVLTDGDATTGTRLGGNPNFYGGYVEVGYLLTGETRGYRPAEATWTRTKVANPFDKGGPGAWGLNARIDYLDLDASVRNGAGLQFINGGKQIGYGLSVNWMPIDYVRFVAQYVYTDVKDVLFTTATPAFGSSRIGGRVSATSNGSDSLSANVFGLRAQIDW